MRSLLTLAATLAALAAHGQEIQVYRCGNAYSDSPCGQGQRLVLIQPSTVQTTPGAWQYTTYEAAYLYTGPPAIYGPSWSGPRGYYGAPYYGSWPGPGRGHYGRPWRR